MILNCLDSSLNLDSDFNKNHWTDCLSIHCNLKNSRSQKVKKSVIIRKYVEIIVPYQLDCKQCASLPSRWIVLSTTHSAFIYLLLLRHKKSIKKIQISGKYRSEPKQWCNIILERYTWISQPCDQAGTWNCMHALCKVI